MGKLTGAIFDLDGIVVNTVPIHFKAWKKMFGEYGVDFTWDDYKEKVDGIPRVAGAKAILTDLPPDELEEACDKKQGYFLELLDSEEVPVYQSTVNLLMDLKKRGLKVAVASSSKNCKRILKRIDLIDKVDAIVDGFDIKRPKPDPQIFQLAAERIGCGNKDCVVFEDAILGVEAAVNAGSLAVGVDRYGNPDRLNRADIVVTDLAEINYEELERLAER